MRTNIEQVSHLMPEVQSQKGIVNSQEQQAWQVVKGIFEDWISSDLADDKDERSVVLSTYVNLSNYFSGLIPKTQLGGHGSHSIVDILDSVALEWYSGKLSNSSELNASLPFYLGSIRQIVKV